MRPGAGIAAGLLMMFSLTVVGMAPASATTAGTDGTTDTSSGTSGTSGDPSEPQPTSTADANEGGANGDCPDDGSYCSTRDGSDSENGAGDGEATGKPCAGCVGKADNKNPQGQQPGGSDGNAGYECDTNQGVGQGNPAHTGCTADEQDAADEQCAGEATTSPEPTPAADESADDESGEEADDESGDEAGDESGTEADDESGTEGDEAADESGDESAQDDATDCSDEDAAGTTPEDGVTPSPVVAGTEATSPEETDAPAGTTGANRPAVVAGVEAFAEPQQGSSPADQAAVAGVTGLLPNTGAGAALLGAGVAGLALLGLGTVLVLRRRGAEA